jgi:hypothetical protein
MNVRRARYDDMPAMLDYMKEYHKTSNLSNIPFIRADAAKILDYCIGHKECQPLIAVDDEGTLHGILCGMLEPYFFNKKMYYATDLQFMSKGAGMQLLAEFKRWANSMGAETIMMAVSSGDARADAFLELSGLEQAGNMYVLHLKSS